MPSKSRRQHNFMAMAANNPAFAKKTGISQKVAREFVQADEGALSQLAGKRKAKSRSRRAAV